MFHCCITSQSGNNLFHFEVNWQKRRNKQEKHVTERERERERDLRNLIRNKLNTILPLVGYRQMTECINLKYSICVSKEDARTA